MCFLGWFPTLDFFRVGFFVFQGFKMVTLKERKKIKEDIEKRFGVADALPLFMLLKEPQLKAIQAGDFSSVPAAIKAAGLPWDGITGTETDEKKTGKQTNKPKTKSKAAKSTEQNNGQIEKVTGDIIPRDLGGDILTESDKDVIQNAILDYITLNIDGNEDEPPEKRLKKELRAAPSVWGAICKYIGIAVKKSGIINDREYIKTHGGRKYKPEKVSLLADYFLLLCNQYNMMPLILDFCDFAGISWQYFNGYATGGNDEKRALTSLQVQLMQKFKNSQEVDLSRRLGQGMQNPTGSIFILKNLHGWKDEKTVEHTTSAAALPVSDLPKLAELGIKDD